MKKFRNYLWFTLCLCMTATAATSQRKVETTAEKVMLFVDGAQVTRTKQVELPAGNSSLIFTGLSPYLDARSMQVSAKGKLTITNVNLQYNFLDSVAVSRQQEHLQQTLKKVEKQQEERKSALALVKAEQEILKNNCTLGNKSNTLSIATIREATAYFAEQMKELTAKELATRNQLEELTEQYQQLLRELRQAKGKDMKRTGEILVGIHAPAACTATFTLSYYVKNAGWFPSYDIRSESLAEPLSIIYKANIFQHTGEEWKNIDLSLSSSSPSTGNVAPRLESYRLNYGWAAPNYRNEMNGNNISGIVSDAKTNEPLAGATVRIPGTTVGCTTDIDGHYSLTMPEGQRRLEFAYIGYIPQTTEIRSNMQNIRLSPDSQSLDEVVVTGYASSPRKALKAAAIVEEEEEAVESIPMEVKPTRQVTGYEFDIKIPYTILSNNKPVVAEIGRYDLPASYVYQCTPKIDKDAFLMARLTDWNKLNLLEGEANIYFEKTFIGKSVLDLSTPGDTLSFSLGRDHQIAVQRTKEHEYTSRKLMGSSQTQTISWKISVRNHRLQAVELTLCDQVPVSANSSIVVTAEELSGGKLDENTGIITWPLTLKPGEQRDIILRYKVKYPKDRRLDVE
ncbi:mucoidy inhibitor MuiA family protein [Culturomica massiliensis]|uniref:mucoidy inhibitor MuiA family protein n=1 Tax=Culturomica massiliensis TaxID=1841857 RepID=UPI000837B491|nr:mucoidy inhibitor MuiA family protein [Culturomica massiliensis]